MPYLPHRGEQARAPRRICRLRRQTGSGTSCRIFCPTGRKQAPSTQIDARSCIPYPPHFLPYRQKTGASVADFRVRRREIILIVFSDVTVVALRLARPKGRANRATSSKPARFIRHWRRFADFHVRQKKRLSARKRARLRRVRCRGLQSPSKSGSAAFFEVNSDDLGSPPRPPARRPCSGRRCAHPIP